VHPILIQGWLPGLGLGLVGLSLLFGPGCRQKVTPSQCEAMVAHYAELVVRHEMPGAPEDLVRSEQKRVREEANGDEGFRNCTTEVGPGEYACAMSAATPDAVEKCLE
jgi:hypothetical protein